MAAGHGRLPQRAHLRCPAAKSELERVARRGCEACGGGSPGLVLRRLDRQVCHGLMGSGGFRHVPASSCVPSGGEGSDAGSSYASGHLPCLKTAARCSGRACMQS